MRKSSAMSPRYRPGTSRHHGTAATFREQMTDYARGEVLQDLRSKTRMSRENVAAEIGVTTKSLYAWEMKNGAIKWDNAKRLAAFYDVAPDSLVTRDPDEANGMPSREQLNRIEENQTAILARLDTVEEQLRLVNAALVGLVGAAVAQAPSTAEQGEGAEGQATQGHRH